MENKNELSDIVLEKDGDKILKVKRVLIIIAVLIIIFLAVLLSMKLLNKPKENATPNLILPPEPTTTVQKTKKDEELFKQVPIVEEKQGKKDDFEKIVKNLKEKETKIDKIEKTKTDAKIETKSETTVQPVVKAIKKTEPKAMKTVKKVAHSLKATNGIYIQVGATSKFSPDKKFLEKIKKQKLNYRLLGIKINGKKITKILVGPFKSRAQAKANLANVRKELNKHAFIYSVK